MFNTFKKHTWIKSFKCVFKFLLFAYFFIMVFSLLANIISEAFFDIDLTNVKELQRPRRNIGFPKPLYLRILQLLIITPIVEELLFRGSIISTKRNFLLALLAVSYTLIISFVNSSSYIWMFTSLLLMLALYHLYYSKNKNKEKIQKRAIIISSILFGLFHITNFKVYDISLLHFYLYKMIPLMILGFFLAKIRIQTSLRYSVVAHAIFNVPPFIINFLL